MAQAHMSVWRLQRERDWMAMMTMHSSTSTCINAHVDYLTDLNVLIRRIVVSICSMNSSRQGSGQAPPV